MLYRVLSAVCFVVFQKSRVIKTSGQKGRHHWQLSRLAQRHYTEIHYYDNPAVWKNLRPTERHQGPFHKFAAAHGSRGLFNSRDASVIRVFSTVHR